MIIIANRLYTINFELISGHKFRAVKLGQKGEHVFFKLV